jgi:uncharacterized ion transporter superfamily protein YfcC
MVLFVCLFIDHGIVCLSLLFFCAMVKRKEKKSQTNNTMVKRKEKTDKQYHGQKKRKEKTNKPFLFF